MAAPARIPLPFALAFLFLGLMGLAVGVVSGWSSYRYLTSTRRADGKVLELVRLAPGKGVLLKGKAGASASGLAPLVEYEVDGRVYCVRGQAYAPSCPYAVGETVTVLYSIDRPSEGKIECFSDVWLTPILYGSAGGLFVVIGVTTLWLRERSPERQAV
jgi:hypothetical protein